MDPTKDNYTKVKARAEHLSNRMKHLVTEMGLIPMELKDLEGDLLILTAMEPDPEFREQVGKLYADVKRAQETMAKIRDKLDAPERPRESWQG